MFTKTVRRMCRNIALHLAVLTNERENRPWNFVQVCSKMGFGKRVRDLNSAPRLPVYQSSLLSEDLHIYWTTQSFYRPRRSLFTWLLYFSCAMLCANKYRSWQTSGRFDIDRIRWNRSLSLSLCGSIWLLFIWDPIIIGFIPIFHRESSLCWASP